VTSPPDLPRLEGDTLFVSPRQFEVLHLIPDLTQALRVIGLTDEQIEARHYRDTTVVVEDGCHPA
jgi:hypothetical protein